MKNKQSMKISKAVLKQLPNDILDNSPVFWIEKKKN